MISDAIFVHQHLDLPALSLYPASFFIIISEWLDASKLRTTAKSRKHQALLGIGLKNHCEFTKGAGDSQIVQKDKVK